MNDLEDEPPCAVCHHAFEDHVDEHTRQDNYGNETFVTAQCLECEEADNCWGYVEPDEVSR